MIGFRAEYAGGELKPDGKEVVESGWFDREHLPEIPRHGSIARAMLDAWIAESRKGDREEAMCLFEKCINTNDLEFAGLQPNGRSFSTTVMNFYSFDADGKICNDIAATGIAGILQGIGAIP